MKIFIKRAGGGKSVKENQRAFSSVPLFATDQTPQPISKCRFWVACVLVSLSGYEFCLRIMAIVKLHTVSSSNCQYVFMCAQ